MMFLTTAAFAQQPDETRAQQRRLQEIEERRAENAEKAKELRERAEAARQALEEIKTRLVLTADSLQEAENDLSRVEETILRLDREATLAEVRLEARQEDLSQVLAALVSLERARPPALAVSPNDATKAAVAAITLSAVTPEIEGEAQRLKEEINNIERLRQQQATERVALEEAQTALAERRLLLEELLAEREALQQQDEARIRTLEREDERLASEANSLRDLITAIEARKAEEALARSQPQPPARVVTPTAANASLPARFSLARSMLAFPAAGQVIARFGEETVPGVREDSIAIATRPSAVVTAPYGGKIDWADNFGRLGNVIIIDVGEQYRLVLIGLGRLDVRSGQQVGAGEPLGIMGDSDPGILKLQIRRRDVPINPGPWLKQ